MPCPWRVPALPPGASSLLVRTFAFASGWSSDICESAAAAALLRSYDGRELVLVVVLAGAGAGGPGGGGMMPGGGMNMNGGPMMGQMMNMGPMMNQMMEMGVGMGDMGMGGDGSGAGQGQGVGVGAPEGQVGMGMGVGEGFGPGGAPGQGMMGMGMNPEFAMQVRGRRVVPLWKRLGRKIDERAVQDPTAMGQQMYPGMEGSGTPVPVAPAPTRGVAQGQFRGRGMPQGMRGRGVPFAGRGRGPLFMSVP